MAAGPGTGRAKEDGEWRPRSQEKEPAPLHWSVLLNCRVVGVYAQLSLSLSLSLTCRVRAGVFLISVFSGQYLRLGLLVGAVLHKQEKEKHCTCTIYYGEEAALKQERQQAAYTATKGQGPHATSPMHRGGVWGRICCK